MRSQDVLFSLLVFNHEAREHILSLMNKHDYPVVGIAGIDGLLESLKERQNAIIFIDSEAVLAYGAGVVSKIKMACQECRLILLCSHVHRKVVKPVMELGAYGCILEPYPEWELLMMVKPILLDLRVDRKARAAKTKRQGKKSSAD